MKRLDFIGIAFVLIAYAIFTTGISKIQSNTEDVLQWLPDHSEAREQYDFFESQFGGDDFLIVTWTDCTVDDPRVRSVSNYVRDNDVDGLIQSITNGAEIIDRLSSQSGLSPGTIVKRFRGVFFGVDNPKLTSLFIELSLAGTARRRDSLGLVWNAIDNEPGLERSDVGMGGYPYIATFIDNELNNSYSGYLLPSILMATIVALFCLRNIALTLIVFVTAVGAACVSVAFIPLCGMMYGGLMSIIPALVFVLTTSGSIHLIRYGLNAIGEPGKLLSIGWRPCLISATTTAIGMLSLVRSDFPAIRNFGLFCASGVGFALLFQLVMVPWLLDRIGQSGLRKLAQQSSTSRVWLGLLNGISRTRYLVAAVGLGLMVAGQMGVGRLSAEVEVEKLFQEDSEIIKSLVDLESRLGPMDQTELLVTFRNVDAEHFPDRAQLIRRIQGSVLKIDGIDVAYSLINALPNEPRKSNVRNMVKRSAYRNLLRRERERLTNGNLLFVDPEFETWRISIRFPFSKDVDFGFMKDEVTRVASQSLASFSFEDPDHPQPNLIYTGKTHLFYHAQATLLEDLFQNFALAFLIITPILIIVLRSVILGAIAMIPNIFPTLVVFGGLGWCNHPIDLAIAMTASVALGIAVDDTTHFLIRFRDFGGSLKILANRFKKRFSNVARRCSTRR